LGRLEFDGEAVICCLDFELAASMGHVLAEVSEDQAAAVEVVTMFAQLLQAEMKVESSLVEGAFADEEIASGDLGWEIGKPAGVAGVGNSFLA
jgi:hypothetical protein